jgi:hypothetical protein
MIAARPRRAPSVSRSVDAPLAKAIVAAMRGRKSQRARSTAL